MKKHIDYDEHEDERYEEVSPYSRDIVLLLCCIGFIGFAGIHRLYVGRIGTGILWFFTGGLFGIGTLYDLFKILKNDFEDGEDRPILPV